MLRFRLLRLTRTPYLSIFTTFLLPLLLIGAVSSLTYGASYQMALAAPAAACQELIVNGNFEESFLNWDIMSSERPATRTPELSHNGRYAMRLGIIDSTNLDSTSGIGQSVMLPANASSIVLTFHYFPLYDAAPGAADLQYVEIYNDFNSQLISRVVQTQSNQRQWILKQFDLTAHAGQQVRLYFTVKNDGAAGRTAMYIDDVSLLACDGDGVLRSASVETATPTATTTASATPTPSATATPSATTTPSATPTSSAMVAVTSPTATFTPPASTPVPTAPPSPTFTTLPPPPSGICGNSASLPPLSGCRDIIINGGFETNFDSSYNWHFGQDPVRPDFTNEQVFRGGRSVRLGNPSNLNRPNIETYSSVRQWVQIPANAQSIQLRWYRFDVSEEPAIANPNNLVDRQDVILLANDLKPIEILSRLRCSTNSWQEHAYALDANTYRGRGFFVYFNIYNDGAGGRSWSYLDDVRLTVCTPGVVVNGQPVQYPTAVPSSTFTPLAPNVIATWTATLVPTLIPTWTLTNIPIPPNTPSSPNEPVGAIQNITPSASEPGGNLSTNMVPASDLPTSNLPGNEPAPTVSRQGGTNVVFVTATLRPTIVTDNRQLEGSSLPDDSGFFSRVLFNWLGACGILFVILGIIAYFSWGILSTLREEPESDG